MILAQGPKCAMIDLILETFLKPAYPLRVTSDFKVEHKQQFLTIQL